MTFPGFFQKKARRPERFFTLIEVLAAMAVLSLLMLMLFQFFGSAQRAWSNTEANNEVFENARVVFDLLQRDLQGARARQNDIPSQNISFYWSCTSSNAQLHFVSTGADDGALNEVGYVWATTPTSDPNVFTLLRAAVGFSSTSGADPYLARSGRPTNTSDYQPVVDGVVGFALSCSPTTYSQSTEQTTLPDGVMVQITLLDKKSYELWTRLPVSGTPRDDLVARKGRTFSKIIPLSGRQ